MKTNLMTKLHSVSKYSFILLALATLIALTSCKTNPEAEADAGGKYAKVKLTSLSLTLDGGSDNLISFKPAKRSYVYELDAADKGIFHITAEAGSKADVTISPVKDFPVPTPADGAKVITVALVEKSSGKSAQPYTVTVIPEQSEAMDDYKAMSLAIQYDADSENLITGFNTNVTRYTVNTEEGRTSALVNVLAMSKKSKVELYYGGKKIAASSGDTGRITNKSIAIPTAGAEELEVKVYYGDNSNNQSYFVTVNAPSETTVYKGNVAYSGNRADVVIHGIEARSAALAVAVPDFDLQATVDNVNKNWTLTAAAGYVPESFVVIIQDGATTYVTTAKYPASIAKTGINITVTDEDLGIKVASSADLAAIPADVTAGTAYALSQTIDVADLSTWAGPTNFGGTFYGNGYQILNLKMTNGTGNTGLFGSLGNGAKIYDFVVNVSSTDHLLLSSGIYFGGVVGSMSNGGTQMIKGVTVKGALSLRSNTATGHHMIGGFIGENVTGNVTFEDCASEVDITIDSTQAVNGSQQFHVGGFVGKVHNVTVIRNSYASGKVDISIEGNRTLFAGALIGFSDQGSFTVENCYASGAVTLNNAAAAITANYNGASYAAGGFIGYITAGTGAAAISNSAAVGEKAIAAYAGTITAANYGTNRITGIDKKGVTYANNFARKGMLTGSATAGTPDDTDGSGTAASGLAKELGVLQTAATWTDQTTAGGLGWDSAIWDFSALTSGTWPKLKNRSHI
jgi:hypothetical protein